MSRFLPDYNQLMRYTINDVCNWLAENRFGEFVKSFREHGIDGNRFVSLTDLDLSKMSSPMNKRKDLMKLIKELPKPADSRVKGMIQPQTPATPVRDYNANNANKGRPPPPLPTQNGADEAEDDGSGPEDDYEWAQSDFSDVSSEEEDYENTGDEPPMEIPRPPQQFDIEDSDSAGSYEEPDPQTQPPPPSVPRRGGPHVTPSGPHRPVNHNVPINKRPVPQIPQPEDQPVYEETNEESEQQVYDETEDQPVYEDPEEEKKPTRPTGRKQLPIPGQDTSSMARKAFPPPMRMTSEPDSPAPPPPRGKGKPAKMNKKAEEQGAPAPPPPRAGRKQPQPPSEPEPPQDVYEDPDNPQQSAVSGPTPQDEAQEVYEDPDAAPIKPSSIRMSALPPLPKGAQQTPITPSMELQEVYEDPDAGPPQPPPSRTKASLPPTPKPPHPAQKTPHNAKKAPPPKPDDFEQLDYEVPDEVLKGQMPQDDYMEMQPAPEEQKQAKKVRGGISVLPMNGEPKVSLPPRPGKKQLPVPPTETSTPPETSHASKKPSNRKSDKRPLPQPVDKTLSLEDQTWYHGDIERPAADSKLMEIGTNGCYLIRRSKKGGETKPYTLAIIYEGQVFNLNIRKKTNNTFALGMAKPGEQEFPDLIELVTFFQGHRLILAKGQTRLKKPCPK